MMLPPKKRWFFSAVVSILFFGCLESCAWWMERRAYLGDFQTQNASSETLYIDLGDDRPHLRPGAELTGKHHHIEINSLGFRSDELQTPKPKNGIRIWFIGGSTTFDIYAPNNHKTWPSIAGQLLDAHLTDQVVEIVNAGVPGEVIRGNRLDFERNYAKVRPDILVLHAGPNDLRTAAHSSDSARGIAPEPEPGWMHKSALYRVVSRRLQLGPIPDSWKNRAIDEYHWSRIRKDLHDFLRTAREKGLQVVLSTHAHRAEDTATGARAKRQVAEGQKLLRMDAESVIATFLRYNTMVRELAAQEGAPLVDLRAAVPPDTSFFGDHSHYSSAGSQRAGEAAFELLKNLELRPKQAVN